MALAMVRSDAVPRSRDSFDVVGFIGSLSLIGKRTSGQIIPYAARDLRAALRDLMVMFAEN
jgi:hypothetical protein